MKRRNKKGSSRAGVLRICAVLLIPSVLFPLASCSGAGYCEPEQVCLVSAVGFDAESGGRIRVSLEVPAAVSVEETHEAKVFSGSGNSVESAMQAIAATLAKRTEFSHCALMVLGDGLTREQTERIFEFAGTGLCLPLATQVASAPDAEKLLRAGSLSTPAAGYDIPEILKRECELLGLDIRCRIYELRANASPGTPVPLPRFRAADPEEAHKAVFCGLHILRHGKTAVTIPAEQCVFYAALAGLYSGGNDPSKNPAGTAFRTVGSEWHAEYTEPSALTLLISVSVQKDTHADPAEEEARRISYEQDLCALCNRLKAQNALDTCFPERQLASAQPQLWERIAPEFEKLLETAEIRIVCGIGGTEETFR